VNVEWVGKYEAPQADDTEEPSFTATLDALAPPPADSTRGITVFEILISGGVGEEHSRVYISGRLSNGLDFSFEVHGANDTEKYVGRQVITSKSLTY
jgi:hypothetical protein